MNASEVLDGLAALPGARDSGATGNGIIGSRLLNGIEYARAAAIEEPKLRSSWKRRQGGGATPLVLVADDRLRLAKALIGVAEAIALAAESIAIERGIGTEEIAQTEALALHAAAFNGMPDPVFHLTARAMAIVMGLAAVEPDPCAPDNDVLLDAALQAATGLAQLLRFRGACATAETAAEREAATACLLNAEAELTKAAGAVSGLLKLVSAAAGRTGASDLN